MNDLQKVEFELLKQFIDICDKHNIQYFFVGGSALGAVRHQGFIPWDDDIDVALPRKDYDKFIKIAREIFVGDTFLQTYETDKYYPYNFAKLRNSQTTYIEATYRWTRMNHGAWIDIFPLDGVSRKQGKITRWMKWKVIRLWPKMWCITPRCFTRKPRKSLWAIWDIFVDILCYPLYFLNAMHWMNKSIDKSMKKIPYDEAYYVANYQGSWLGREVVKKELLGKGKEATFEGIKVIIPEKYDEYLTAIYGDYMTPPPVEKQVSRHHTTVEDVAKPYTDYLKRKKNI